MPFPACPDTQSLEQFVLGLLDEGVAGDLERHISDCASCVNTLRDLSTRDDLVDILRAAAPIAVADPEISAVLFRMRKRPPVVPAGDSTEALGTIREYRLLAKLGEGGMGTVYWAQHTKLKRQVVIRVLPPDRVQSPHRRKKLAAARHRRREKNLELRQPTLPMEG